MSASVGFASPQIPDVLILDSKLYTIAWPESPFPLESYLEEHGIRLSGILGTGNWNRHHAIWLVRDKKLYLIGLDCELHENRSPGVNDFPGSRNGELFAAWFTGSLTLEYGLWYFPREKQPRLVIQFENGVLKSSQQEAEEDGERRSAP